MKPKHDPECASLMVFNYSPWIQYGKPPKCDCKQGRLRLIRARALAQLKRQLITIQEVTK
jgi:hypothetical protein